MLTVTGGARVRQLQLATGGRYKGFLVDKIVARLKENFLQAKTHKLTLAEILKEIEEVEISDDLKTWLIDQALPNHQKIRVIEDSGSDVKFAFKPPYKFKTKAALLKLLEDKYNKPVYGDYHEIGLLKHFVHDSNPMADRWLKELLEEGKIQEVLRLDKQIVLYYKNPDPELEKCKVDTRFVDLWHNVDVKNKDMAQIREYLKNRGFPLSSYEDVMDNDDDDEDLDEDTDAENESESD